MRAIVCQYESHIKWNDYCCCSKAGECVLAISFDGSRKTYGMSFVANGCAAPAASAFAIKSIGTLVRERLESGGFFSVVLHKIMPPSSINTPSSSVFKANHTHTRAHTCRYFALFMRLYAFSQISYILHDQGGNAGHETQRDEQKKKN